jgi:hypothetical protein
MDTRWRHRRAPDERHVLFDARTAMEYAMLAPLHQRLRDDPRVRLWFMSSERPDRVSEIYRDAGSDIAVVSAARAMTMAFDACLAADFVWATLPRGTQRVQLFHGVAGKWSQIYDRPETSMRQWHRFFFINRRRLQNFVAAGALEPDSPAIRLVGMPKSDALVDGSLQRDEVLASHGLDPSGLTVLYAPTWTPHSSLNAMGAEVVERLVDAGFTVLVKLHENSLDPRHENSGGIDWAARLAPILARGRGYLARDSSAAPWLAAADALVSDHSSVAFEYLLVDRPLVRIDMPSLLAQAQVGSEYVELMAQAATSVTAPAEVVRAVEDGFADPDRLSRERRHVAEELFYKPGGATARALAEIYDLMELASPAWLTAPAAHVRPARVGALPH